MRAAALVLGLLSALLLGAVPALASFDGSRTWFDALTEAQRADTQAELILLGHYKFLIDGQFGRATFDAITSYQRSQGEPDTGVLSGTELTRLQSLADAVSGELGLKKVEDKAAGVSMVIPAGLLTEQGEADQGSSYSSADGQFSLETMHVSLAAESFRDIYAEETGPEKGRHVDYKTFGDHRFVVSGTIDAFSFYTMFISSGDQALGYSLTWGKDYDKNGQVASIYIASHFEPLNVAGPPPTRTTTMPTGRQGDFFLPAERPDVIVLDAEITDKTPSQFEAALKLRPAARILVLNSPGGGVDSALVMARTIRKRGLDTDVPSGMGCYSACAYMFFAGVDRQADGELGVHQIYSDVSDTVLTQTTLGDLLDALYDFGVQQPVISKMLRTPPENMYVFTPKELRDLGINRGGPLKVAIQLDKPSEHTADTPDGIAAYVMLASLGSADEAGRSRDYLAGRWSSVLDGVDPEVFADSGVWRVRVPAPSLERANSICAAIRSGGGGCYVTAPKS